MVFGFCDRTGDRPGDLGPEHVLAAPPEKGRYGLLAGGVPQKGPDLRHTIGSGASGSAAAGGPASLEPALTTLFPPQ